MPYYVYIMSDELNKDLAIDVCSNLPRKVIEHKRAAAGDTKKKKLSKLVYYEIHAKHPDAIAREKIIKMWEDSYLRQVVAFQNPKFHDLTERMFAQIDLHDDESALR